ncbi:MAG: hypothetical protein ACPGCP_01240 [Candidatus Nanopelagicales bacterium]
MNTHELARLAGDRCGLVAVHSVSGDGARSILTTPRRAEMLTHGTHHGMRWALTDEEV